MVGRVPEVYAVWNGIVCSTLLEFESLSVTLMV
jgi:hypothetical protein